MLGIYALSTLNHFDFTAILYYSIKTFKNHKNQCDRISKREHDSVLFICYLSCNKNIFYSVMK